MLSTFLLSSEHSDNLVLEQLHLNLWFFDFHTMQVDTGLLLGVPKDLLTAVGKLDLICHTPFSVNPESVQDLFTRLEDEKVLQLLFNDEVATKSNVCCIPEVRSANLLKFKSGRMFVVARANPQATDDWNKLQLRIDTQNIDKSLVQKEFSDNAKILIYVRLRYGVKFPDSSNIYFSRGGIHQSTYFDLRFNEPRLFEHQEIDTYHKQIRIGVLRLFVIAPIENRLSLDAVSSRSSVRSLEREREGWSLYNEELHRRKGAFVVYYWKVPLPPDAPILANSFDMLVRFDRETKDVSKQLNISVAGGVLSYLAMNLAQTLPLASLTNTAIAWIIDAVKVIGYLLLTISLGVAADAIWSYLSQMGGKRWNRQP